MYYEECVIDGVLHWRGTPTGTWRPCTPERLSFLLTEARTELQSEKARADAAEADSKRLDWLAREWEKNGAVAFSTERPRQPAICNLFTVTTQHIKARGFREVIDAAIGATHD